MEVLDKLQQDLEGHEQSIKTLNLSTAEDQIIHST